MRSGSALPLKQPTERMPVGGRELLRQAPPGKTTERLLPRQSGGRGNSLCVWFVNQPPPT